MIKVGGIGPLNSSIVIVGEALGENEEKQLKPFVGLAGRVLDEILEEVGIKRDDCYITNYYKSRPKNNKFATIPKEDLAQAKAELEEELVLVKPNVIVCLGEHTLNAVTGLKGIKNWRGSVLMSKYGKVIPTYHPSAISREWTFRPVSVCDWHKIKKEGETNGIKRVARNLIINSSFDSIIDFLGTILATHSKVSFDVEVETGQINCIAFAVAPVTAMCIPFWFGASGSLWSEEQELKIWQLIKEVLENPDIPKIAQNAQYDMTILRDKYGINVKGLWLDTMIAFHSIYPELPKALALLTSLYTDVPYYKGKRLTKDMQEFFEYNAMDACVTYECAEKIFKEMQEFGIVDFYYKYMHSLIEPLLDICAKGIRIDTEAKKKLIKEVTQQREELQSLLDNSVGKPLNVNSPKQMLAYLYTELKLKPKYKKDKTTGEKRLSADEDALNDLYKETGNKDLKTILDIRECNKLLSTYLEVTYDKDGGNERAKTSYLITGTETGRLSSRETVYGTGTNLQNVPKTSMRRIFIPDEGKVFINADLSQAEIRVVAWLANEQRMIKVFENGGDIHTKNAVNIFRKVESDISEKERDIAKKGGHAADYGIGPITFSKEAGIYVSEAKQFLNAYFSEYPSIKLWQMNMTSKLRRSRTMTTPFGRKRTFFNRWSESLQREAFAYVPQSTVVEVINIGLIKVYEHYKGTETDILLQNHDALLLQCPRSEVGNVAKKLRELLTIAITVNHKDYYIPVDISVGENWWDMKKLPLA